MTRSVAELMPTFTAELEEIRAKGITTELLHKILNSFIIRRSTLHHQPFVGYIKTARTVI